MNTSLLTLPLLLSGVSAPALASPKMLGNPYGEEIDYSVAYDGNQYLRYMYNDWFLKGYQPTATQGAVFGFKEESHELIYALNNLYSSSRNINFETPTYYLRWAGTTPGLASYNIEVGTCLSFWQFISSNSQYHYYELYNLDGSNLRIIHWSFALASSGQYNEVGYSNSTSSSIYLNANDDLYGRMPNFVFNFNNPRNIPETQPVVSNASLYDIVEDFYDNNLFNNEELENMTASVGENNMSMRSWLSHTATIATLVVLFVAVFSLLFGIFRLFAHLSVNLFD